MNAKKVCCLITVTAMLFFGLPSIPFANVDQSPQLSQEELGLVFQNSNSAWNEKPDFLKYLDEQEMKETKGKQGAQAVAGAILIEGAVAAGESIADDYSEGGFDNIDFGQAAAEFVGGAQGAAATLATPGGLLTKTLTGIAAGQAGELGMEQALEILSNSGPEGHNSGGGANCGGCHK